MEDRRTAIAAIEDVVTDVGNEVSRLLRTGERLRDAGLDLGVQKDTDCCFSLADKLWVSDPDGNPWEVYLVKVVDTAPDVG